jgi:hypothetical protein
VLDPAGVGSPIGSRSRRGAARRAITRSRLLALLIAGALLVMAAPAGAEPGFAATHSLPGVWGSTSTDDPDLSISCPAVGSCVVLGPQSYTQTGNQDAVLVQSDGTWGKPLAITPPANATPDSNGLTDVDCWSIGNCVAIGNSLADVGGIFEDVPAPVVAQETDGVWGAATDPFVPTGDTVETVLTSVSCDASGDCTVAGLGATLDLTTETETDVTFVSTELSGSGDWSTPTDLVLPTDAIAEPLALACTDATDCTMLAFGDLSVTPPLEELVVSEVAGAWGDLVPFPDAGGRPVSFSSLACPAAGDCVAVGESVPSAVDLFGLNSFYQPAVAVETSGVWGAPRDLALPRVSPLSDAGYLTSVSCYAVGSCEAVGAAVLLPFNKTDAPIAVTLSGAIWSRVGLDGSLDSSGSGDLVTSAFAAVACNAPTTCLALGVAKPQGRSSIGGPTFGFTMPVTLVEPLTVSGAPRDVVVGSTTTRTVVDFKPPTTDGGSAITQFVVVATSPAEPTRRCSTSKLQCSLTRLAKGHRYAVTVVATNSQGTSKPSPSSTFVAQ